MTLCDECEFVDCEYRNEDKRLVACSYSETLRRKRDEIQRGTESKIEGSDTERVAEGSLQHNGCNQIEHVAGLLEFKQL
jgi:hypothetical protein